MKATPTWSDVKSKLADFDRAAVLALLQDLYASSKENQAFLHARFGLCADILKPYKTTISRWLWPDTARGQETSISKAKKAIADYKKAVGRPDELAELMTFYCEQAAGFCHDVGFSDESFFVSLMGMFRQTLKLTISLAPEQRDSLLERLDEVSLVSRNFGYGLGEEMDDLLDEHLAEE
ncbi:hypothetical protein [Massilia antarctica]|uniref:hypothetical protein n=1 Tax=Massilia antarctica TaxID=2765360 RepID=UPI00226E5779|nr:hypothetical protein [Massilia sp. H27-R4]MCY0916336.1 hypothetical protein [Massilia sp. H27-R4]